MKKKFRGTYAELQDQVLLTGIYGEWTDMGNRKQYRSEDGAILNWWDSTKTIDFQGPPFAASKLETALSCAIRAGRPTTGAGVADVGHWQRLNEENAKLKKRLKELIAENAKLKNSASGY